MPVLFKGSGFYSTDHGRGSANSPRRRDEAAKVKSGPDKEDKTERTPEAKAETKAKASD